MSACTLLLEQITSWSSSSCLFVIAQLVPVILTYSSDGKHIVYL
jgi:hypothetical protein